MRPANLELTASTHDAVLASVRALRIVRPAMKSMAGADQQQDAASRENGGEVAPSSAIADQTVSATDDPSAAAAPKLPSPDDPTRTSTGKLDNEPPISLRDRDDRLPAPLQVRDPERYQILNEHGRGGLGRVFRARDKELGRDVAVKELLKRGTTAELRFFREALITARLEHPGIVPVHEAGRWPDGTPFYAMKLVQGRPLKALIDECKTLEERLALLPHVIAVADAIAYAHDRKIIHRDLKPSNVIVGDFGETVVIDWGLAKDLTDQVPDLDAQSSPVSPYRQSADIDGLTIAGSVLGTPAYMAPEQARGEPVDERADIYALGSILKQLCSDNYEPVSHARRTDRRVPADLRSLTAHASHASRTSRLSSARRLADELRAFLRGGRIASHRYTRRERATRWLVQHRTVVRAALAATVLIGIILFWSMVRLRAERDVAREQRDDAQRSRQRAENDARARLIAQASAMLDTDPASALTTLADFPDVPSPPEDLRILGAEAAGLGSARLIATAHKGIVQSVTYTKDGAILSLGRDGALVRTSRNTGVSTTIATGIDGPIPHLLLLEDGLVIATHSTGDIILIANDGGPQPPRRVEGHGTFIYDLALDSDGAHLASAGADRTIRVWRVNDMAQIAVLHTADAVGRVRWADADTLYGCDLSGHLRRWSVGARTSTTIGDCDVSMEVGVSFRISPNLRWLVAPDRNHRPILYDLADGTHRALPRHTGAISEVAFDNDSRLIAAASLDGAVRYIDILSGELIAETRHDGPAYRVVVTSRIGVSAGEDNVLRLVDLTAGRRWTFRGHTAQLWCVALNESDLRVVSGDHLGELREWPLPDQRAQGNRDHAERIIDLETTPTEHLIISSSRDGTVIIRDERTDAPQKVHIPSAIAMPVTLSHSAKKLAIASSDGRLWTTDTRRVELEELLPIGPATTALHWSTDESQIIGGDTSGALFSIDAASHKRSEIDHLDSAVTHIALDADGLMIAGASSGTLLVRLAGVTTRITSAHDGRISDILVIGQQAFLTAGDDGAVHRWTRAGGAWHKATLLQGAPVRDLATNRKAIAVGASDGTVTVFSDDGNRVLKGVHTGEVLSIAIDHTHTVYSAGDDGRIVVWRPSDSSHLVLRGTVGHTRELALMNSDTTLVTAGLDGYVRVWDTASFTPHLVPGSAHKLRQWLYKARPLHATTTHALAPRQ